MTAMSSSPVAPPSSPARQLRRVIVRVTIGSFSVAALMGIAALLAGGSFGETEGRILLTTLLVGVVSVGVLCYLATAGRPAQPVGVAGGAIVLVPFVTGLLMIWSEGAADSELLGRAFGVGAVVAATLAQACLLLSLGDGASRLVRRLLVATLGAAAVVAVTVSSLIIGAQDPPEGLLRALGVVAILDVLGTVTVAALAKFGGSAADRGALTLALPPDLRDRLEREAAASGREPQALAVEAVERYLHDL